MVLTSLQQAFTWCARPHASEVGPVPDARGREGGTSRRREREQIFKGKLSEGDGSPIMFGSERG